jgi:drug/metabolite transporter (DMT)-like permease
MDQAIMALTWAVLTVAAAASQTARNTLQRSLVAKVGTVGATHVRFLFGLPFALLFLICVMLWQANHPSGSNISVTFFSITWKFCLALLGGAVFQILATAFMLAAMEKQSFVVVTAFVKTEPLLVALFGALIIGDTLSGSAWMAIALSTVGVFIFSWPKAVGDSSALFGIRSAIVPGLISASCFAFSVVGFRSAVLTLDSSSEFYVRAILVLAMGQCVQTALLTIWLRVREPGRISQLFAAWKPSLIAGLFGASASAFWFMAFALESAAKVRTLGLIEIFFALIVSRQIFRQSTTFLQLVGLIFLALGMAWLLLAK